MTLLGRGLAPATALSYTEGSGWTAPQGVNLFVERASLAARKGGAVAVARRASKNAAEQGELFWSSWIGGPGFGAFGKVGIDGFAIGGPSIAGSDVATEVTFLGKDYKHYTTQISDAGPAPFAAFPGGQPGQQAFGQGGARMTARGIESWAAYAGDDKKLYFSEKSGPGSTWSFSSAAPTSPLLPTLAPALQAFAGGVTFAYVIDGTRRIGVNTLLLPQKAWAGEQTLGDSVFTGRDIDLLRLGADDYLVVWHGLDDENIYYTRGGAGQWSPPAAVFSASQPTGEPVVLPGVGGKLAEVLFASGGTLRHARYDGEGFGVGEVLNTDSATSVAAALIPAP